MLRHAGPVVFAICVSVSGCKNTPSLRACTLIGCADGLAVEVTNAPVGPWTVAVASNAGDRSFACAANATCDHIFFPDFLPTSVTVTVTVGGRSAQFQGAPTPRTTQPNGKGCAPTCSQPLVTVRAP